ncbi:MAG: GNAT family N-acetyltransferase [Chloroflexi bacterium]|nr:GNAT family N-acetyltransferase [Chloroflexota bacterium]
MHEIAERLIVTPSDTRWHDLAAASPEATIFHHPAWSRLLAECYGFKPMVLLIAGAGGAIDAGCPVMEIKRPLGGKRWVALPFSDHCAPLYRDARALDALAQWLAEQHQSGELSEVEVRWPLPPVGGFQAAAPNVLSRIRLASDPAVVAERIHRHHRRALKKAQREAAIHIERGTSLEHLEQFYQLHLRTRRRMGLPVQPRRFFRLIGERLLATGLGYVAVASSEGVPVAADLFLHWQGTLTYKFSAGIDTGRDARANFLLMWDAIQWGCEHGFAWLDLGRSAQSNTGLRTFKERWGAEEAPLIYSSLPARPDDLLEHPWMRLVHTVIRRSPAWVCQATGELLYKYGA